MTTTQKPFAPSEHHIQQQCVEWFRLQHANLAPLLFAVPNGGHRNITTAQTLKAEGVLAGVSDLILLYPNKTYHALCIEMKTDRGTQSPRQKEWAKRVMAQGYLYVVCRSLQDFILTVNSYLNDERIL